MKATRNILFIILFFISVNASSQSNNYGQSIKKMSSQDCISLLKNYKAFWLADSLCVNGFRELFAWEFISRFENLKGKEWREINQYLGNPDHAVKNGKITDGEKENLGHGEVLYRYILTPYGKTADRWKSLGVKHLGIKVVDGKIKYLYGWEVDG